MVQEEKEFDQEKFKEMYKIKEINNLYNNYYNKITLDNVTEDEKVAGTIYMCMKTMEIPIIYGEFSIYKTIDTDNVKKIVQNLEEVDEGYEVGELSEQNCWDYVFFDLNNNNITAHAEHWAHQFVEFYNKSDLYKNKIDSYEPEISACATMFTYRNITPSQTHSVNSISFDNTPKLMSDKDINSYDVIEAYHNIYEKSDKTPSLNYNKIDDSGVLKEIVNTLGELDLDEASRDNIMYLMYDINIEELQYDHRTVALILLESYTDLDKEKLLETKSISEHKFDRIKNKLDVEKILF